MENIIYSDKFGLTLEIIWKLGFVNVILLNIIIVKMTQ